MPTFSSQSSRSKPLSRTLQGTPVKPLYVGHHDTAICETCSRIIVPRIISYYGQPLRSICPFCGTTFMRFSSGFQRFMQRFQTRQLSFV